MDVDRLISVGFLCSFPCMDAAAGSKRPRDDSAEPPAPQGAAVVAVPAASPLTEKVNDREEFQNLLSTYYSAAAFFGALYNPFTRYP